MSDSVDGLLRYYAEVEPQQLDAMVVGVLAEADDPARQLPEQVEARSRLLQRIAEVRQFVQV